LEGGFTFEGTRVPLVGPQRIFKLRILSEMPLSITTVPVVAGRARPYDDGLDYEGASESRCASRKLAHLVDQLGEHPTGREALAQTERVSRGADHEGLPHSVSRERTSAG